MTLYCPCCAGRMQRYLGNIAVRHGMYEPTRIRQAEYIVCETCPVVSEVDTRTGTLIDLGSIGLQDLMAPAEDAITFVIGATSRLEGRTES